MGWLINWSTTLMRHIKPWSRLHGLIKAPWTRTFKPHCTQLVQRGVKAHWPLDWPRANVVITLKASWSWPLSFKSYGTIKPAWAVRWTIKPPHSLSNSHRSMSFKPLKRSTTIQPARTMRMRSFILWWVFIMLRASTFIPAWRMSSGWTPANRSIIKWGGVTSIIRRRVSWGITVQTERSQLAPWAWALMWRFGRCRMRMWKGCLQIEGPIIRVLTVGAFKAWDWAHFCSFSLVKRWKALTLKSWGWGIQTARTWTFPVDRRPRWLVKPPWVRHPGVCRWAILSWSIIATLLLFIIALALH